MNLRDAVAKENFSIEVSTRCNSCCTHCFASAGREQVSELDAETVMNIISEARALGYEDLHITGGEPLMWEPLFAVLEYTGKAGFRNVFINSNGTLLSPETCRRLKSCGLSLSLSVSLQGPMLLHDAIRGDGSWQRAVEGIREALDAGLPVTVFTSVGRTLLPELPAFGRWIFREFPAIDSLTLIQLIRVTDDVIDLSGELLTPGDFITLVRMAALLNLSGLKIAVLENPLARAAALSMNMPWMYDASPLHRPGRIVVMADRSITLSHSSRSSFGVFSPGVLKNVMNSGEYGDAVKADDEFCRGCPYLDRCRECGMIRPSEWYRDMVETEPYCKRVLRLASAD